MNSEGRIKLAEAMWPDKKWCVGYPLGFIDVNNVKHHRAPDPFTDANDDYAVLEFVRKSVPNGTQPGDKWRPFYDALREPTDSPVVRGNLKPMASYQIGDYARAALKVIDNE